MSAISYEPPALCLPNYAEMWEKALAQKRPDVFLNDT